MNAFLAAYSMNIIMIFHQLAWVYLVYDSSSDPPCVCFFTSILLFDEQLTKDTSFVGFPINFSLMLMENWTFESSSSFKDGFERFVIIGRFRQASISAEDWTFSKTINKYNYDVFVN